MNNGTANQNSLSITTSFAQTAQAKSLKKTSDFSA
jgi:hypothetical protein